LKTKGVNTVALLGVMTAVVCVISMIFIPTPFGFPITLQVFGVSLCGFLLGKRGVAAVAVYLLLGALGLPVFAAFRGGFGELISPTGGFLWSFPILALLCGLGKEGKRKLPFAFLGLIFSYICGGAWLAYSTGAEASAWWLLPCALKDAALLLAAFYTAERLQRIIKTL